VAYDLPGAVREHGKNYVAAHDNADNNIGVGAEALLDSNDASQQEFIDAVQEALNMRLDAITSAMEQEVRNQRREIGRILHLQRLHKF
jgi:hypothetical protein